MKATTKPLEKIKDSFLYCDPSSLDEACQLLERYKRTLKLLIVADFVTSTKMEQAWSIAEKQ